MEEIEEEELSQLLDPICQDPSKEWCGEFFTDKKSTAADLAVFARPDLPLGQLSAAALILELKGDGDIPELEELRRSKDAPILVSPPPPQATQLSKDLALRGPVKIMRLFNQEPSQKHPVKGSSDEGESISTRYPNGYKFRKLQYGGIKLTEDSEYNGDSDSDVEPPPKKIKKLLPGQKVPVGVKSPPKKLAKVLRDEDLEESPPR